MHDGKCYGYPACSATPPEGGAEARTESGNNGLDGALAVMTRVVTPE